MIKLPMNLQFFADESEADQTEQSGGQEETQQTDTTAEKVEEKNFSQEDVNNIAAKQAKKAQEKLLKQLGIEDFDNAKEGMKQFKEWQDNQKTEQQKQQETLDKLQKNHDITSKENATLKAQLSAMKTGVKAESVEDVVALAERLVNDDVTMDDAIKQVVEKYPHFAEAQEQEEEEEKPSFTSGIHTKESKSKGDPFAEKLAKYK
ncbi:phage protein [Oceanobacillus picturae]|uniref:Phage protein n=1 Tax=Oceanobacillus picturae TaxID=171693 RepID=A0A0U9HGC9_9BACI|nr:hypothetical protein [Oceanobacillus picturae]GAQ18028.1 phage protein [Oceanobacillus picturae]